METLQDFKADLFRALANPVRVRILESLRAAGSLTVGELHQRVGAEPANVSQHLSIMRARGIVTARREGTSIWYSITWPEIGVLLDAARVIFEQLHQARGELMQNESAAAEPLTPEPRPEPRTTSRTT